MNQAELSLAFSSCINGVCKLTSISCPTFEEMQNITGKGFIFINDNKKGAITFNEYWGWIETDEEIQEFYLHHLAYLTKENALNRYCKLINTQLQCFQNSLLDPKQHLLTNITTISKRGDGIEKEECYADMKLLIKYLKTSSSFAHMNNENISCVLTLLQKNNAKIQLCNFFYLIGW